MDIPLCTFASDGEPIQVVWGMPIWLCWVLIAVLLLLSGVFSACENAFSNCNKYHFKALAKEGNFTAKLVTRLIDQFDNTLVAILVGNNIIQTLMSFLSAMLFLNLCQYYGIEGLESILSTVVMGILVYVVSDTVPKILSKALPNRLAKILAYPVSFVEIILFPIIFVFGKVLELAHKLFKVQDESLLSKEDLIRSASDAINDEATLYEDGEESTEKLFENDEKEILDNIFVFDKRKVKDVFTPKEKVFSISKEDLTVERLNKLIIKTPFSRIPVYDEDPSNIIGILVLKIYFEEYALDPHLSIPSILEDTIEVDSEMFLDDAFELFKKERIHLGVVKKDGEYIGLISLQDVLEELVDDIDETPATRLTYRKKEQQQ